MAGPRKMSAPCRQLLELRHMSQTICPICLSGGDKDYGLRLSAGRGHRQGRRHAGHRTQKARVFGYTFPRAAGRSRPRSVPETARARVNDPGLEKLVQ